MIKVLRIYSNESCLKGKEQVSPCSVSARIWNYMSNQISVSPLKCWENTIDSAGFFWAHSFILLIQFFISKQILSHLGLKCFILSLGKTSEFSNASAL